MKIHNEMIFTSIEKVQFKKKRKEKKRFFVRKKKNVSLRNKKSIFIFRIITKKQQCAYKYLSFIEKT